MLLRFIIAILTFCIFSFIKYKIDNKKVINFIIGVSFIGLIVLFNVPIEHTTQLLIASSLYTIIMVSYLNLNKIICKILNRAKTNKKNRNGENQQ